ncbi:MAG: diguanylate cyclase [Hydrogenovibrio sp.]|nr:diguanylate cyclase [Hydrogenovibrio sp.]
MDPHDLSALNTLVVNSLEEQIAVIDQNGTIISVNLAWINFGAQNGLSAKYGWIGQNYLKALEQAVSSGDVYAIEAYDGIRNVMHHIRDEFSFEYPCHSPEEKRWFLMRVKRLIDNSKDMLVLSHTNITQRKLAEERAEHLALHDPLTQLANRRYFDQSLQREMKRNSRNHTPISLIEVDIDNFKDCNDQYGHLAGDQCLMAIGQALQSYARRAGDLAARLGGDEFALLLPETDYEQSQALAEQLLEAIQSVPMNFKHHQVSIKASLGVATLEPHGLLDRSFLLQEADKALYRAKKTGKNRVVHAQLLDD